MDKTSISLISSLFDISEDIGGKVLQLSEISSGSLILDFLDFLGLDFFYFVYDFFLEDEELQEHMSDLILHFIQILVPK